MAYSASNLYNHGTGYPGNAYYTYKSDTDTRQTVMTAGYFNNSDDDLNLTADDTIFVVGDQGGYTLRVDAVTSGSVATELGTGSPIILSTHMLAISTATSAWVVSPCDGIISRMWTVIHGVAQADTVMGMEIAGTDVTDGGSASIITITASGSAAGTVDTGTADAANAITEGAAIEVTCDGAGSTASEATCLVEVLPA
jgi:hypothetical protein